MLLVSVMALLAGCSSWHRLSEVAIAASAKPETEGDGTGGEGRGGEGGGVGRRRGGTRGLAAADAAAVSHCSSESL